MFFPYRKLKRSQQPGIFRVIIGLYAQVIGELGDDLAFGIAHNHAVSRRAGIATRATINVGFDCVRGAAGRWPWNWLVEKRLLGQRPSSRRMASRSGKPAAKIFSCAPGML